MSDSLSQLSIDKAKLEKVAGTGVSFNTDKVDDLIRQIVACDEEWHDVYRDQASRYRKLKRLEREAAVLGARLITAELDFGWDEPGLWRRYALGISADHIEEVWREAGGTGKAGWNDKQKDDVWGGPVTELMLSLYEQADIPRVRWPSRSAIRDAMNFFTEVQQNPGKPYYRKRTRK